MKLNLQQIKAVTIGAEDVKSKNGLFKFYRFTDSEMKVTSNPNRLYPAGIRLEFRTDATSVALTAHTREATAVRSYFSLDFFENSRFIGNISNLPDSNAIGDYGSKKHPLGRYSESFSLSGGDKTVSILFPHSVIAEIEEVELADATYIHPVKKEKTLLAYGDSITQGYDALHPSAAYAVRLADYLGAELFNKALGGDVFSPKMVKAGGGHIPDIITVAYGTNDWGHCSAETLKRNATDFIAAVTEMYPSVPIYVITPIWRSDADSHKNMGSFSDMEGIIIDACKEQKNVSVIRGFDLVPHATSLFGDLCLHPSDAGFEHYFNGLRAFLS